MIEFHTLTQASRPRVLIFFLSKVGALLSLVPM